MNLGAEVPTGVEEMVQVWIHVKRIAGRGRY